MQVVLVGIEWKFCFVYLDDILVCSETFRSIMEHLKTVFEWLSRAGLTLKPRKCFFARDHVTYLVSCAQTTITYLGHVISREGVSCTLRKRYWWRGMCGDAERFC